VHIATLPSVGLEPIQKMGAVSEILGKDIPGDLSRLSCGILKGKDRLTFKVQGNAK
jgi:hypothetical protein